MFFEFLMIFFAVQADLGIIITDQFLRQSFAMRATG
jgi:hypothetical protein